MGTLIEIVGSWPSFIDGVQWLTAMQIAEKEGYSCVNAYVQELVSELPSRPSRFAHLKHKKEAMEYQYVVGSKVRNS